MSEGQDVRKDRSYSKEHEWAKVDDGIVVIGISDYAQNSLHEITYVEVTEVGTKVEKGDECGLVESMKASSDIYTPVSGEIVEVNDKLEDAPEIVNESPYDEGWLLKIEPSNLDDDMNSLMSAEEYEEFIEDL
ncbi:glycine cleavage system protein GcvH [Candidatus Thorarchaeota archaeon]|nr:MAG: glycine cleavage system protein GcvH [Candidatus Thorarchaeota archaeon]